MAQRTLAQRIKHVIAGYIQVCNDADVEAIAACFQPAALHYFPPGRTKWIDASTIGGILAKVVQEHGFHWSVHQLLSDDDRNAATMEWTRIDRRRDRLVRGVDWLVFDPRTFYIQEIRCYYAAPLHPEMPRQELIGFDYAAIG